MIRNFSRRCPPRTWVSETCSPPSVLPLPWWMVRLVTYIPLGWLWVILDHVTTQIVSVGCGYQSPVPCLPMTVVYWYIHVVFSSVSHPVSFPSSVEVGDTSIRSSTSLDTLDECRLWIFPRETWFSVCIWVCWRCPDCSVNITRTRDLTTPFRMELDTPVLLPR